MINIQNFYSVHFIIFGPLWSYQVYSVYITPIQSILSTLVHFSFIRAIWSTLVHFGLFCLLWLYSVHIGLIRAILSILVLFGRHLSYSVYFGFTRSDLFLFYALHQHWSYFIHPFDPFFFPFIFFFQKTFGPFLCAYIQGKCMFGLKAPIPNLNLFIKIQIPNS